MKLQPIEVRISNIIDDAVVRGYSKAYVRSVVANEFPELNWKEIDCFIEGVIDGRRQQRRGWKGHPN